MKRKKKILFLQLPRLDHDVSDDHENLPDAFLYLDYAVRKSPEAAFYRTQWLEPQDRLDDAHLVWSILKIRPDVISCTLYLWNIERTIRVIQLVRKNHPAVFAIAGGPEVARDNPILFEKPAFDAAVVGEGESVLPILLRALRRGTRPDLNTVAWRHGHCWIWGRREPPHESLEKILPPPSWKKLAPDARGTAHLETTRGCPMRCTYCTSNQHRIRVSHLTADQVLAYVTILHRRGARFIRFIDPTFNSNPHFDGILAALAQWNRRHRLEFFAELRADRITPEQARRLAAAHFTEVEVGVQSHSEKVLQAIRRPLNFTAVDRGIRRLSAAGIRITLDLMYGLPRQSLSSLRQSVRWAAGRRGVRVQCLQTLVLPGTELRRTHRAQGIECLAMPPYSVQSTPDLNRTRMRDAEDIIEKTLKVSYDNPTRRFVGDNLPDLFRERVRLSVDRPFSGRLSGRENRRTLLLTSADFFIRRARLEQIVHTALRNEPNVAWQFVLVLKKEEPLDLLDFLVGIIQQYKPLPADYLLGARYQGVTVSRRLFLLLAGAHRFSRSWKSAAEDLLRSAFF